MNPFAKAAFSVAKVTFEVCLHSLGPFVCRNWLLSEIGSQGAEETGSNDLGSRQSAQADPSFCRKGDRGFCGGEYGPLEEDYREALYCNYGRGTVYVCVCETKPVQCVHQPYLFLKADLEAERTTKSIISPQTQERVNLFKDEFGKLVEDFDRAVDIETMKIARNIGEQNTIITVHLN
jgi:hypothetical protein